MSLRGTVISKILAFIHRAMAVAHLSIPSSGTTSSEPTGVKEYLSRRRLESVGKVSPVPMRKSRHTPVGVSFAPAAEVIVSASDRSSRMVRPGSPVLL